MNKPIIRPLRGGDLPAVLSIWLEGNLDAHPFVPASYWMGHAQDVCAAIEQAEVYVAEAPDDRRILGFIGLAGDFIAGLFVLRGARSQGVGRHLLHTVQQRRDALTLHVYRRNANAVRFYERAAFAVQACQTDPDTDEAELVMLWRKSAASSESSQGR